MSDEQHWKQAVDGRSSRPPIGDLKISAFHLASDGTHLPIRIMRPIMVILGMFLMFVFIVGLTRVGSVDGPHPSAIDQIRWTAGCSLAIAVAMLIIYLGLQLPRFGLIVTSRTLKIVGLRTRKFQLDEVTAVDIGETWFLCRPMIAPVLVLRGSPRVPIVQLSIGKDRLGRQPSLGRLRPLVEELRLRVGVHGVEEELPHFNIGD